MLLKALIIFPFPSLNNKIHKTVLCVVCGVSVYEPKIIREYFRLLFDRQCFLFLSYSTYFVWIYTIFIVYFVCVVENSRDSKIRSFEQIPEDDFVSFLGVSLSTVKNFVIIFVLCVCVCSVSKSRQGLRFVWRTQPFERTIL